MLSKDSVSSCNVLLVTDDTCFFVCVQKHAQSMVITTLLEDVQRDSALTLVVGLLNIPFSEEHGQVFLGNPEDALIGDGRLFIILVQQWRANVEG